MVINRSWATWKSKRHSRLATEGRRRHRRTLVLSLSAATLATGLSFTAAAPAMAGYNPGQVCNQSSVSLWLVVQPMGSNVRVESLAPNWCTPWPGKDVEGVWSKRCDYRGNNCSLVAWKVNGYTTSYVRNGYISPIPPGRTLYVSGSGYFYAGNEWPRPSLNQVNYELRT